MHWKGVMPAITTPFAPDGSVDYQFLEDHARRMLSAGCTGIVALGSLGEGATLSMGEKLSILERLIVSAEGKAPIVAAVSALSTRDAVALAVEAEQLGCEGLMVLPAYVHKGPWREVKAHFEAVFEATPLSCMLYNNPVAYGTDVSPTQTMELADAHANLRAVKESSTDVRRVTALRTILGDRLALFVGVDDVIVEGVAAGATGWIAGVVNALPEESVRLFELATVGQWEDARRLYDPFLPLLRMDTVPEFVQLIKLMQQEAGLGSERVRAPRLAIDGLERDVALAEIRQGLAAVRAV